MPHPDPRPEPVSPLPPAAIRALFGPGVAVATARAAPAGDGLFAEEQRYIAEAGATRQAEFGTARICARRALAELGIAPCPLVPYPDRSPRWPADIRGTIAHAGGICAAAVTAAPHLRAIGLDIEPDLPLARDLERVICTDAERRRLEEMGDARGRIGKLIFSAKEAWYKCQYGISAALIDFREVTLTIDLDRQRFRTVDGPVPGIEGRYGHADGFLITTATLQA